MENRVVFVKCFGLLLCVTITLILNIGFAVAQVERNFVNAVLEDIKIPHYSKVPEDSWNKESGHALIPKETFKDKGVWLFPRCLGLAISQLFLEPANGLWVNSPWGRRPNGPLTQGHECERYNCFSKMQLVGQKCRDKTTLASKMRLIRHCFGFQSRRFSLN